MNNPPIHITPHNLTLSPTLRELIRKKMSRLSRFAGDMLASEIVLRGKSGAAHLFSISARLALPGRDIQGNAVHKNLYAAIDQLVARLGRLCRKRKTRLGKRFRSPRSNPAAVNWFTNRIAKDDLLVRKDANQSSSRRISQL